MKQLPNILTLANLFCGMLAIIFTLHTPVFITAYQGQNYVVTAPSPVYWASVMIGIAAVIDFFDGFAARWLHAQSLIGKELDSLADVVTFAVAPGMILYQLLHESYMMQPGAMQVSLLSVVPALLLPCFAAYRLAKFNVDDRQQSHFLGIPTPAVGLLIASFPLILLYNQQESSWLHKPWFLYILIFLLGILMVCNIPFFSLKIKHLSWKSSGVQLIIVILTLISIPFLKWLAVPFAFTLYVVFSVGKFWFFPE